MAKEKPGFYIWFKTVDVMAELTFEEKGRLYSAMAEYARDGVIPTFDDRLLRSIWTQLQYDLNADHDRYVKVKRDNQIKGWTSDFKRNYAPKHGIDPNDEEALQAFIELRQQQSTVVDSSQPQSTNNNNNININNNSSNNNKDNNTVSAPPPPKATKHKYGEYNNVLLTDEELDKLKADFPSRWAELIENLSEYIASTGKAYKSHYATIRSWARKDKEESRKPSNGYYIDNPCSHITPEDHENDSENPF